MRVHLATLLLLALATLAVQSSDDAATSDRWARLHKLWRQYKAKYNWSYPSAQEESFRFELFSKQLQQVEEHNSRNLSWTLGINHLSVLTDDEFTAMSSGLKVSAENIYNTPQELGILSEGQTDDSPDSFSWRNVPGVVGRVKNQGHCASCWAFVTTGLLESRQYFTSDNLTTLSEQQLVDCAKPDKYGDNGCKGYALWAAIDYVIRSGGVQPDSDYPYVSGDGETLQKCRFNASKVHPSTRMVKRYATLKLRSEDELKQVLFKYGPIPICLFGAPMRIFRGYKKGVIYSNATVPPVDQVSHGVLLVGYGSDPVGGDYWVVKNSWGTSWGIGGYGWLARNRNNFCNILDHSLVVL